MGTNAHRTDSRSRCWPPGSRWLYSGATYEHRGRKASCDGSRCHANFPVLTSIVLFRHVGPGVSKPLIQLIAEVFIGGIAGLTILLSADAQLRMSIRKL